MSYRDALSYFNLKDNYTEKELKYSYTKLTKTNKNIEEVNINLAYDILSTELRRRKIKELKEKWLLDINKLKDKYQNTTIYNLCQEYESKLEKLIDYKDISELKDKFNLEINKLKNEITLPLEKRKIVEIINKYLEGYSKEVKNLASYYSLLIMNSDTLEKLNTLKQKFDILLKEELVLEEKRKDEFKKLKDSFKRASIYRFIEYAKNNNLNNILHAHNILILVLSIINEGKIDNLDEMRILLDDIKYLDIEKEYNKLKEFFGRLIDKIDNQYEKIDLDNSTNENVELVNLILEKYYLYATNKNTKIEKIIQNEKTFKDIISEVSNYDLNKKRIILKFIENEGYKDIKIVLEAINDFNDLNKIYIERATGEICVINANYKKIYSINLNGVVKNNIKSKQDIFWEYISLSKFFKLANYSDGLEIREVEYEDKATLSDYYVNYLYFTDTLLLCLKENNGKKEFIFLPALSGFKFKLGENSQITKNDYFQKYLDKNICLNDLMEFIYNKVYTNDKEESKKIR